MLIHREDLKAPKRVDNEEETITRMFIKELKTATNEDLDADEIKPAFSCLNKRNVVMVIDEAQIVFQKIYSKYTHTFTPHLSPSLTHTPSPLLITQPSSSS